MALRPSQAVIQLLQKHGPILNRHEIWAAAQKTEDIKPLFKSPTYLKGILNFLKTQRKVTVKKLDHKKFAFKLNDSLIPGKVNTPKSAQ